MKRLISLLFPLNKGGSRGLSAILFIALSLLLFVSNARADTFVSGSTGADGAFNPTSNTTRQLPSSGIFNFTTVNIPSGVTVTFIKNAANTPVYILATGDVTISGTISVSGSSCSGSIPGQGGPGGYGGGYGGGSYASGGSGLGPGRGGGGSEGDRCNWSNGPGGGGSFGTVGRYICGIGSSGSVYGNTTLVPLIGGSGGGGSAEGPNAGHGGGGGGGAILIASSTSIMVNGSISANGGDGYSDLSGGGSGGAIRLLTPA